MRHHKGSHHEFWCQVLNHLAAGKDYSEVSLGRDAKESIGEDGFASLAQHCRWFISEWIVSQPSILICYSFFNNTQMEIRDDALTVTSRMTPLSSGSPI